MTNEDLKQIAEIIQQENQKLEQKLKREMETVVEDKIRGVKVLIENDIGKRIDSLFDGYKLAHEKQWELEHKVETLERRLEVLETKVC